MMFVGGNIASMFSVRIGTAAMLSPVRGIRGGLATKLISCYSTQASAAPASSGSPSSTKPIYMMENRKTEKPILSRKTFLMDYYKYLNDNNEIVLYVHHNNIPKGENKKLRSELKKAGAQLNVIANNIYTVYLRSAHEQDPASPESTKKNQDVVHPLHPLLSGPTAIITIPKSDPSVVSQVLKVVKGYKDKLFVVGARIESSINDIEDIDKFKDLPTKEQLNSQLAGLLTILGGAGLVRTLESASTHLYLTLEQHRKDIDPNEE